MSWFELSTFWLAAVLALIVGAFVAVGHVVGRWLVGRGRHHAEPIGVVQGTLLALVGLLLAFGLAMAVDRYDHRRDLVVTEANAIGTTYLRAQLLPEPARSATLELMKRYGDLAIVLADQVPSTAAFTDTSREIEQLQRELWTEAGRAVTADPTGTGPRAYVETLNEMIDAHTARVASLDNRVPGEVMLVQVAASAIALGVLALYLTVLGRRMITSLATAVVVILILFVSFDLDRPQRGFITVPFGALTDVRASMDAPPAAGP